MCVGAVRVCPCVCTCVHVCATCVATQSTVEKDNGNNREMKAPGPGIAASQR